MEDFAILYKLVLNKPIIRTRLVCENTTFKQNMPPQNTAAACSLQPSPPWTILYCMFLGYHLGLKLHLCIRLVQPAVEVGGQKQRLLLVQSQTVPPALLLLLDLDVHLTLSGFMIDLESVKKKLSAS